MTFTVFCRGDYIEYKGERWTVYADEDACGAVDLCRTEDYAQPLGARVAGVSASVLRLVRSAPDRTLGKGADIDYIERENRERRHTPRRGRQGGLTMPRNASTCDYNTGTAGSGPSKCGKPAKYIWRDPDSRWKDRLVCGTHARSAERKFGGDIRPIGEEN